MENNRTWNESIRLINRAKLPKILAERKKKKQHALKFYWTQQPYKNL